MNALSPHPRAMRTTCPYAGSAAACWRRRTARAAQRFQAIPRIRRISGGCARRAPRLARRCRSISACCIRCCGGRRFAGARRLGYGARRRGAGLRAIVDRDGPNAIAFYLSGQLLTEDYYVANKLMKGFLGSGNIDANSRYAWRRRSPATAALSAPIPCRASTGSRRSRPRRAGRLERGMVPSGPVPAEHGREERARHQTGRDRSAAHRHSRGRGLVLPGRPRHRRRAVLRSACTPRRHACARLRLYRAAHAGVCQGAGACREIAADIAATARAAACSGPTFPASANFSATPSGSSPVTRRESMDRRRAPTRSTPSSTFAWPPAGGGGRAWGRSR